MFLNVKIISQAEFEVLTKADLLTWFVFPLKIHKEAHKIPPERYYINFL